MALKKSQLYSSLWESCNQLRGGMDASQYKDYVLTLLFMKYVSDKFAGKSDAVIEVPKGGGFADMVALKGHKDIGEKINTIICKLAEANDLDFLLPSQSADFNDENKLGRGKDMQDRLSKLVAIFDGLDFRGNRAEGDDLLGDAYEYLMRHFATDSGKSKGQFYTPAEVSRILASVVGINSKTRQDQTIYDPTCGSGSLLLKAADYAPRGVTIYGQENDNATWALAKMNMILHGQEGAELWRDNTLAAPYFKNTDDTLKTFDFAVANPPFSTKSWSNGLDPENDEFERFADGIPPSKNGDYAFLLHLIKSLKSKGKGAIILPHGVLFRGNKEADIRRNLIKRGFIKGIIGLPANLFYGTGIPACIVVIDKETAKARTGIFMIDASKSFIKDGNKNRLRAQDLHKIVDVFNNRIELPRYSRMVPVSEISSDAHEYNLNIPRYVDTSEPEDLHDLDAHLNGGIPNKDVDALDSYWEVFPSLRKELFKKNGRAGYSDARIETQKVKPTILAHSEYTEFSDSVTKIIEEWRAEHRPLLNKLTVGSKPREVVAKLSEDLLECCDVLPLLNNYDVYQRLMDYWAEVMQDDIYLIAAEGWVEAAQPRGIIENKDKKLSEEPDLTVREKKYKTDLVPPALLVESYFGEDKKAIEELQTTQEAAARELEEFTDEHTGEEGLLESATSDAGKVTKTCVKTRLKAIKSELESDEEQAALARCLELLEAESAASKALKVAQAELDSKSLAKYATLTENEIKTLVVDDKWFASIFEAIDGEVQRITRDFAGRVKELEERYADPLPELEQGVDEISSKVDNHLKNMGLAW